MRILITFFVILSLFVLPGLFLAKSVYADASDKDVGLNSEERTSIRNFEKQIKKSIEDANLLIRKKELGKAKKELENILVSIKEKVSAYENNARILVSKGKENSAKIYYRGASSLEKFAVQISGSLQKITSLEKEYKIKKLREESAQYTTEGFKYLRKGGLDKAEANFKKAIALSSDNGRAKDGLARVEKARIRSNAKRVSELLKQTRNSIRVKDFDKAEKELNEALTLAPNNRQALNYLEDIEKQKRAESKSELKQKEQARLEKQRPEENKFVELIKLGRENLLANNFEEAKKDFSEALKVKPKNELAMKYLSQTEQAKKDYERNEDINKIIAESKKYVEQEELRRDINRLMKEIEVKVGERE